MKSKKVLIWLIAAVAIAGFIVWRFIDKARTGAAIKSASGQSGGKNAPVVDTVLAKAANIQQSLDSVVSLDTPFKVQVSPTVAGLVQSVLVREGDAVKKGQILATIDPSDAASQLAQAKANAAEAQSRYTQAKVTQNATNVGTNSAIEQQNATVGSSKANEAQTRNNAEQSIQSAQSAVVDGTSKLRSAQAMVVNQQASVAKETATYNDLQIKLDRTTTLFNQRFVAAQDVDDAKAAAIAQQNTVKVAEAMLNQARQGVISAQAQLAQANDALKVAQGKAKSDIVAAQAQVTQAQAQYKTVSSNKSQIEAYQENLAALVSTVNAAKAQVVQAQVRLDNTKMRSTIDGTVTTRSADPGTLANPGTPILVVQFLDWLYGTASITVEDSTDLQLGMKATITLNNVTSKPIYGTLIAINQAADPTSRQVMIRLQVPNNDHVLHPGMFGHMTIVTKSVDAPVTIPKEAIRTATDGTKNVAVVDSDLKLKIATVTLGVTDGINVEITSGLKAGDRVVSLAYDALKDGEIVRLPPDKSKTGDTSGGGSKGGRKSSGQGQ